MRGKRHSNGQDTVTDIEGYAGREALTTVMTLLADLTGTGPNRGPRKNPQDTVIISFAYHQQQTNTTKRCISTPACL